MTDKQIRIQTKYTGVREEALNSGQKSNYHIFRPIEANDDIKEIKIRYDNPAIVDLVLKLQGKYELNWNETDDQPKRVFGDDDGIVVVILEEEDDNNNTKKAKDCPTWLEQITYALATKCEDWETKRKKTIEDLKKGKCFHEKGLPSVLNRNHYEEEKKTCSKCKKKYLSEKSNGEGDKKTLKHNCSQKPNNQDDEEEDDDNDNSNNKIAEKSTVRKYCRDNDIQKLEYDEETGKLIITYKNNKKPKSELDNLTEELQEIKNYLKKNGQKGGKNSKRRILMDSDWEENQQNQPNKTDWMPWIIAGGIGLFVIVLIAVIGLVRKGD